MTAAEIAAAMIDGVDNLGRACRRMECDVGAFISASALGDVMASASLASFMVSRAVWEMAVQSSTLPELRKT